MKQEDILQHLQAVDSSITEIEYVGEGEASLCFGNGDLVALVPTGHGDTINDYPAQRRLADFARSAGVRTPKFVVAYASIAILERAPGIQPQGEPRQHVEIFRQLGEEIALVNSVQTKGYGRVLPGNSDMLVGEYATWSDFLANHTAMTALASPYFQKELGAAVDIIRDEVDAAKSWVVESVLVHYDNRLPNVYVADNDLYVIDWDLSLVGAGLCQELIKIFEVAEVTVDDPITAAFLDGYGATNPEDAVRQGALMLVLDGLQMAYGWHIQGTTESGVQGWLASIKRIANIW